VKSQKNWNIQREKKLAVALDIVLTEELKQEGLLREFMRTIQDMRKKLGFKQEDRVTVTIETNSKELQALMKNRQETICKQTNSKSIKLGKGDKEARVNEFILRIKITK
jgi:isoleucyl-tRNA synthetase